MTAPSLDRILRWLFARERVAQPTAALLEGLFQFLVAEGLPLRRAMVALRTLHPEIVGLGYLWRPEKGLRCDEQSHGEFMLARFLNSPMPRLFEGAGPLRFALEPEIALPFPVLVDLRAQGMTGYLGLSLPFASGAHHALTLATDRPGGFTDEEAALLEALAPALAVPLEARETRRVAATLLDTYVGPRAGERILAGRIRRGDLELLDAVVFFCDLRGFTKLTVENPPIEVVATLNAYFDQVCAPLRDNGGEVLKFMGDGVLAAFPVAPGAPLSESCAAALRSTEKSLENMAAHSRDRVARGLGPLKVGASLHVGEVAFGNIGTESRLDFTVIGQAVNLASRLAGQCGPLGRELIVSSAFARHAPRAAVPLGRHVLRGIPEPEELFTYELGVPSPTER